MPSSPVWFTTVTGSLWWRCAASRPGCTPSPSCPPPPAAVCGGAPSEPLPAGVEKPVIDILLAMLGGHMERGWA